MGLKEDEDMVRLRSRNIKEERKEKCDIRGREQSSVLNPCGAD